MVVVGIEGDLIEVGIVKEEVVGRPFSCSGDNRWMMEWWFARVVVVLT